MTFTPQSKATDLGRKSLEKKSWSSPLVETKSKKKINEGIFVTGFATEKGIDLEIEFDVFRDILKKSRAVRRMGSAALDLCHVASGIFDGFWERGLAPWDVAASGLICLEAGVLVSNYEGDAFHPFQSSILAARKPLDNELPKSHSSKITTLYFRNIFEMSLGTMP